MQTAQYRVYVDGVPILQSDLDLIDTITVQQAMDQAWSASIVVLISADETGVWNDEDSPLLQPMVQIRVEIMVDNDELWVPLIDGPVVGYDTSLSPQPSASTVTVRVSDDSTRLFRTDDTSRWTGDTDSDVARNIFQQQDAIATTDIDDTPAGTSDRPSGTMQRSTPLETLRELASRHPLFHAWVAPGDEPGQSIGMFKSEETTPTDLPPLILLGAQRNLDSFSASNDQQRPANVKRWRLDLGDLSSSSSTSNYSDILSDSGGDDADVQTAATVIVPPGWGYGIDPDEAVKRYAAEYAQAIDAHGVVRSRCYPAILQPYKMVLVIGANGLLSGGYVIKSVSHTITRSEYSQDFALMRRGESGGSGSGDANQPPENMT